ncbi:hypothetical protein SPI_06020 [Niveomyces insectorum RCEF 264]|uniref:HNH nuclease domain-containing protein n=1 Tax=Niveomyces insectorum RCEF 264 TaxID=1081102 RepID=A0A167SQ43_9HYPO|nr:hypothetical protein SPI_06020 [Niveomyces insectorum RCEF 264]
MTTAVPTTTDEAARRRQAALFLQMTRDSGENRPSTLPYNRPLLLRLCYQHALSEEARARFLEAFFERVGRDRNGEETESAASPTGDSGTESSCRYATAIDDFADHLVDHLFLPLKAAATCAFNSVLNARRSSAATPGSLLEGTEAGPQEDAPQQGPHGEADQQRTVCIFPPSPMTNADEDGDLSEAGQRAASLFSLLDDMALSLLHTPSSRLAEQTHNTVRLDEYASHAFSRFQLVLVPAGGGSTEPPAYRLEAVDAEGNVATPSTSAVVVQHASPRLLALHCAIARILYASGVGQWIDAVLDDTAVEDLDADGTTNLGRLMQLRLDGWWNGSGQTGRGDDLASQFWVESSSFAVET